MFYTLKRSLPLVVLLFFVSNLLLFSCKKDTDTTVDPPVVDGKKGVFICNEGPFMSGTGTLSYMDAENNQLTNSIYELINNKPLGNIVQSMEIANGKGYVVVNNANKIEVIDMTTMKWESTIEPLTLPRYFCQADERRAYVSCWDNTVAVINLLTGEVEKHIPVQTGPEKMIKTGDFIFVLNQGGYGIDSTISIININNDQVVKTLQVYPKPTGVVADQDGMIWVMCSGKGFNGFPAADDSEGHLLQIDPQTLKVINDLEFPDHFSHPEKLVINKEGDKLYYLYLNSVFECNISADFLPQQPLIRHNGYLYALGLDKATNDIYISDPVDFVQNGWVFRYKATGGMAVDSFQTGIIPTHFCFN